MLRDDNSKTTELGKKEESHAKTPDAKVKKGFLEQLFEGREGNFNHGCRNWRSKIS